VRSTLLIDVRAKRAPFKNVAAGVKIPKVPV
jgi:hypothetical protein